MKIKKFLVAASVATLALSASAANPEDVRIYINPGHGAYCGECRPMSTIKHGNNTPSSVSSDTSSFFESNTNLQKGFGLLDKLVEYGVKYDKSKGSLSMSNNVVMSRVKSGGVHNGAYDRPLSEIAAEAETFGADMFISIHSNATTGGHNVQTHVNHCLYLFRGYDGRPKVTESDKMATACWPHSMSNKHMNYNWLADPTKPRDTNASDYIQGQNYYPSGTDDEGNPYWIKGDLDFMYEFNSSGSTYGYYGVLAHDVPGFLVEGYDHTYQPGVHRAMNHDVTRHEGEMYARGINDYFGWGKTDSYGKIYGIVRDHTTIMTHAYYQVTMTTTIDENSHISPIDNKKPINNVLCRLLKNGTEIDRYTTDDEWNGAFFFKKVEPGTYTIEYSHDDYATLTEEVVVTANETTYLNVDISNSETTPRQGHFAYALSSTKSGTDNILKFKSTGAMDNAKVVITNISTGSSKEIAIGSVVKGENTKTISAYTIGEDGDYTWQVVLNNPESGGYELLYNNSSVCYNNGTYDARIGVAIDKDPTSSNFGTIYTSTSYGQGIQRFNPDFTLNGSKLFTNKFGIGGYSARLTTNGGTVYVANYSTTNPGVWSFNPATSTTALTQVTSHQSRSVTFTGNGSSRKMYALTYGVTASSTNSLLRYDIGTATTWSGSSYSTYHNTVSALILNGEGDAIASDKGVTISQTRYCGNNTSSVPVFACIKQSGAVSFNSSTMTASLNSSQGGGMAYNSDMSIFAIVDGSLDGAADVDILFYDVTWSSNVPTYTYKDYVHLSGTYEVSQLAFDYADNLYVASRQKGLLVYAVKNPARQTSTPALDSYTLQGLASSPVTDLKVARQCYGEGSNTSAGSVDALVTWSGSAGSYTVYYQTMRRDASTPTTRVYDNNGTWVEAGTATIASGATTGSFTHKALAYGTDANGNYDRIYNYKVVSSTGEEAIIEGTGKTITSFAPTVPVNVTLTQPTESIDLDGDNTPETLYSFNLQLDLALNDNFSASRLDDGDAQATATQYVISVDEATATALNNASNASEIGTFVAGPTTISAANCSHHSVDGWYMIVDFTDVKPADAASAAKSIVWKNVNPGLTYQPQVYVVSSRAFNFNASDKESASLTMTVPAPEWTPANDEVVLEALTGDYSSLASTEDKPMGTFRLVGSTTETNPVVIANANTVGTNGAALSPLPVTDDVIGTSANGYADAGWNVAYTITLKEGDAEVAKSTHDAQTVDASLYSNSEKRSCDVMGLKVGTKSETTPDGRTRLVYNADYTPTYTMVVEATYTRGDVSVTGTSEHELTINPTFATPEIKTGDDSRGLLFLETSTHWDEAVSKYYKYYYDAVVNLTWDIAADNLNYYIGYHATPKFECLGHYEKNSEGVTSSEWVKYYPASVLTNSAIESYNSRTTPYLTELGYTGAENWSLLAAQSNHLPMKIHYVYGSDSEIGSDLSVAGADVELSADYPIIVGPSLMVNQYPETGTYALSTLSRAVVYDMQVISAVKSFSGMTMDDIINTPATGVENVGYGNGSVRLFPNPVSSHFTLQAPVTITDVKIFASDGQLVKEVDADDTQVKIDVSDLASGVYVVHAAGTSTIMIKK